MFLCAGRLLISRCLIVFHELTAWCSKGVTVTTSNYVYLQFIAEAREALCCELPGTVKPYLFVMTLYAKEKQLNRKVSFVWPSATTHAPMASHGFVYYSKWRFWRMHSACKVFIDASHDVQCVKLFYCSFVFYHIRNCLYYNGYIFFFQKTYHLNDFNVFIILCFVNICLLDVLFKIVILPQQSPSVRQYFS